MFIILLLATSVQGCMKKDILSSVGVGGGFPPYGAVASAKFSLGSIDENLRQIIGFWGIYRPDRRDVVPVTTLGLLFELTEIDDRMFPMVGSYVNLTYLFDSERKRWDATTEFLFVISAEAYVRDHFSLFWEFPVNVARSDYIFPKFSFIVGGTFYLKK